MANPNIYSSSTVYGENSLTALSTTNATSVLSNAASSGKVFKVNSIIVSNVDGTAAADITINFYSAAALGGTAYPIVSTLSVPADSSVIVIDKTTGLYVKENQSIGATASAANDLVVVASWEDIS
jgi:hypothetical protein